MGRKSIREYQAVVVQDRDGRYVVIGNYAERRIDGETPVRYMRNMGGFGDSPQKAKSLEADIFAVLIRSMLNTGQPIPKFPTRERRMQEIRRHFGPDIVEARDGNDYFRIQPDSTIVIPREKTGLSYPVRIKFYDVVDAPIRPRKVG